MSVLHFLHRLKWSKSMLDIGDEGFESRWKLTRKHDVDARDDGPVDGVVDGQAVDEQDADRHAELESNPEPFLSCLWCSPTSQQLFFQY